MIVTALQRKVVFCMKVNTGTDRSDVKDILNDDY